MTETSVQEKGRGVVTEVTPIETEVRKDFENQIEPSTTCQTFQAGQIKIGRL